MNKDGAYREGIYCLGGRECGGEFRAGGADVT